jgi:hypothetical protein
MAGRSRAARWKTQGFSSGQEHTPRWLSRHHDGATCKGHAMDGRRRSAGFARLYHFIDGVVLVELPISQWNLLVD